MTAGIAKMTMNDVISCVQMNSGMRLRLMPGAFILKIVVMMMIALLSVEISTSVTICDHKSTRWPGENCGPDSGVYANHPTSGPMSETSPMNSAAPAKKYTQ